MKSQRSEMEMFLLLFCLYFYLSLTFVLMKGDMESFTDTCYRDFIYICKSFCQSRQWNQTALEK